MEVFLLPAGETRYELYCEPPEHERGVTGRVFRRLREFIAAEQRDRRERRAAQRAGASRKPIGWTARVRAGLVRGMSEWIAEQRLLWRLRHEDRATLVFPDDIDAARALSVMRSTLRRDVDHHRVWMVTDGLAVLVLGPLLFLIPGPNLISWYFAAKLAGHWLAFQGARQGLSRVTWSTRASDSLTAVRETLQMPRGPRRVRLRAISKELELEHLVTFVERTAAAE